MLGDKTQKDFELEKAERGKFGDDPNAIDRLKIFGLHEKDGKFYQQIGDDFFEVEPPAKEKK